MKTGDLVKHPAGIRNVCKETYSMGIVLSVHYPNNPPGQTRVEVMWRGKRSYLVYCKSQLEVISESR